jgi:hypothetical protein
MLLINSLVTFKLISFNIKFIILINYIIELIAPYNNIMFYKSLSSINNIIRFLLLK